MVIILAIVSSIAIIMWKKIKESAKVKEPSESMYEEINAKELSAPSTTENIAYCQVQKSV